MSIGYVISTIIFHKLHSKTEKMMDEVQRFAKRNNNIASELISSFLESTLIDIENKYITQDIDRAKYKVDIYYITTNNPSIIMDISEI